MVEGTIVGVPVSGIDCANLHMEPDSSDVSSYDCRHGSRTGCRNVPAVSGRRKSPTELCEYARAD